jgi:periplasmic protein TonB
MRTIINNLIAFSFIQMGFTSLYAQNAKMDSVLQPHPVGCYLPAPDSARIYMITTVQVKPQFPRDINKYFVDSVRYPDEARKKNIQGKVFVGFIVETNGSVSNIVVLRSPDISLSNEAKRLISAMPKWIPGKQNGKPVRVQETVPVSFKL